MVNTLYLHDDTQTHKVLALGFESSDLGHDDRTAAAYHLIDLCGFKELRDQHFGRRPHLLLAFGDTPEAKEEASGIAQHHESQDGYTVYVLHLKEEDVQQLRRDPTEVYEYPIKEVPLTILITVGDEDDLETRTRAFINIVSDDNPNGGR